MVQITSWQKYSWLQHGFTKRAGGLSTVYANGGSPELNLGLTPEDSADLVQANRRRAVDRMAGTAAELANVRQVHGTSILQVSQGGRAGAGDGLITQTPGVVMGVLAADCVPILLADVRQRIVAALHAGWRGTAAGMAGKGVAKMVSLGARSEDLVAAVGPSIGPCCYAVGEEVRMAFAGRGADLFHKNSLNLWEANRRELIEAGVPEHGITVVGECTACSREADNRRSYFSHRAEGGVTGRAMGLIGIGRP